MKKLLPNFSFVKAGTTMPLPLTDVNGHKINPAKEDFYMKGTNHHDSVPYCVKCYQESILT